MKQATQNIRTIDHADHTDIERLFYVYSPDGNGGVSKSAVWAVVWCGLKQEKQAMTKFIVSYYQRNPLDEQDRWTIKRDTINADSKAEAGDIIAECDCEVIKVETAEEFYNQIEVLKAELKSADEVLRLFHSIASNGEQSVLSRLDNGVDAVDAQRWQDAPEYKEAQQVSDNFNFDTVTEQEF